MPPRHYIASSHTSTGHADVFIIYETAIPATGYHNLEGMPSSAQLQRAGLIPPLSTGDTTTVGGDERSTGQ